MISKSKRLWSVVLLATFITVSAFTMRPVKVEGRQDLVTWTRNSANGNTWVQGTGGSAACISAARVCQYRFEEGYDPNDHEYDDNIEAGEPLEGGSSNGFKNL